MVKLVYFAEMSEWSKEDDLRSSVLRTRGFKPRSQHIAFIAQWQSASLVSLRSGVRNPLSANYKKRILYNHSMNKDQAILIHDVASLTFLAPFSVLCLAETLFGYTVYPMFLTHALTTYMSFDQFFQQNLSYKASLQIRVTPAFLNFTLLMDGSKAFFHIKMD